MHTYVSVNRHAHTHTCTHKYTSSHIICTHLTKQPKQWHRHSSIHKQWHKKTQKLPNTHICVQTHRKIGKHFLSHTQSFRISQGDRPHSHPSSFHSYPSCSDELVSDAMSCDAVVCQGKEALLNDSSVSNYSAITDSKTHFPTFSLTLAILFFKSV